MKIVKSFGWSFIALMMIVSFSGCLKEDSVNIPRVKARFTFKVSEAGTVTFLNTSTKATKYAWDFGDGQTSSEVNPVKVYKAGTFFVNLTASNAAGASDVFKDTLNIVVKDKVSLPITFDNTNVDYKVTTFNGASFAIIDNPSITGSNNKAGKVGAITNSGVAFEGVYINLESQIDLTTNKTIAMNVRSNVPVGILMKLEEGTSGPMEVAVNHGGTGWENLLFNFNSSAKYSRLTIFVDGPGTTKGTFYVDDIIQKATETPCTPETAQSLAVADFNLTFQNDPGTAIASFDATYSYATNPNFKNAVNPSCKVGKIDRNGGALFANNQITFNSKLDFTTKSGFKLKVYSSATAYNVLVKLEDKTNSAVNTEISRTTSVGANQWEELTFPFAGSESGKYDKIILFFQLNTNTTATYYIDDFSLYGSGSGPVAPTVAAPTPPARAAGDVISIFSNAYSNITGVDYNPNWGQGTVTTTISVAGNATLKYASLNYQGTDFAGNAQNVSAMSFLHVDFWTANSTALELFTISPGPVEKSKTLTVPTNGNWRSVDIALADFSPVSLNNIIQLKVVGNGDVYLDNIYFYRNAAPATAPTVAAPTPPARAAGDVISVFSNAYTNITGVDYNPNWGQGTVTTTINVAGNSTLKYANLNYQGTDFSGNAQNVSAMSFLHVDFWTANSTALNFYIISPGPVEKAKALTVPTNGNWTSIEIPLSDFSPVSLNNIIQFKVDGNGDVFFDNLYFYKPASGGGGGTNIASNGNFETGTDSGWLRFQNGGTSALDNTTSNGGSWSGKLATNGPSNPAFKQERIGAGVVKAGDVVRVQFDHKGTVTQPGAVFNVILFGEGASGASFTNVFNPAPTPAAGWATFTGNFTIPAGTDVSQGISFLIEAVCGGASGCSVTANIDNVSVVLNP